MEATPLDPRRCPRFYGYSQTSQATLVASIQSTPRRAIARPWWPPRYRDGGPSSRTATLASASSTGVRARRTKLASTSPPRQRCTARWTCGSGWSRWRRR
jgi:hypothetical protein